MKGKKGFFIKYGIFFVLFLIFILQVNVYAGIKVVDDVLSVEVLGESGKQKAVFQLGNDGVLEVIPYADDVVRVRWHWDGIWEKDEIAVDRKFSEWEQVDAQYYQAGNNYYIETDNLIIEVVMNSNIRVNFKDKFNKYYLSRDERIEYDKDYFALNDSSYINLRSTGKKPQGFKLKQIRTFSANEAIFGLGEYAGTLNRRGKEIQCWNSDTYSWGEDRNPMYMSLPFFYGVSRSTAGHPSYAYGIFFNNPSRPFFRFGTQWEDKYSFEAADGQIDYFFFGGGTHHTMKNVLKRYTELTGKPTMLPKWAYGNHLSRWSYDNQGWVEWLVDEYKKQDIPLDSIYLDIDYMDTTPDNKYEDNGLHQLQFNYKFPDPKKMVNYAESRGVKLVPLIEPWLTTSDPKYQKAAEKLHFIKDNHGYKYVTQTYFGENSWLDFTSTPTRNWWKSKVLNFLDKYPFEGIWNDLNEPGAVREGTTPIPLNGLFWMDGRFGDNNDSRRWFHNVKNTYANYETSLTYDILMEKYTNKRPFVLSRAGWPGIQKYALNWSGDNVASYDHLRHNIRLGLSTMISGQVNFGHDVGGFVGSSGGELMTRWTEWAALTPFFRNHSQKGDPEREPFRYSEYYKNLIVKNIKFRYQIMPYLYTLAYQSTQTGIPMNTPMVMDFMNDANIYDKQNDYNFMVGDYLMVAPVYKQGEREKWAYLPGGEKWYYWYDDHKYEGGNWVCVDAPLGQLPMFVREGAIIPLGPVMQHVNEYQPEYLDLHIWPSKYSQFTLYEDDGETWDFKEGEYAKTKIESIKSDENWKVVINEKEGNYQTGRKSYIIIGHDINSVDGVKLNNVALTKYNSLNEMQNSQGYYYESVSRKLFVKVVDKQQTINLIVSSAKM